MPKRDPEEILADFCRVENGLSPEMLYCDGERSHAQAAPIARRLRAERAELVRELGYEPCDAELWGSPEHDGQIQR